MRKKAPPKKSDPFLTEIEEIELEKKILKEVACYGVSELNELAEHLILSRCLGKRLTLRILGKIDTLRDIAERRMKRNIIHMDDIEVSESGILRNRPLCAPSAPSALKVVDSNGSES